MDDKEYINVYVIPANYTDSGRLLGGMLEVRNTIETCFLILLLGYPQVAWLSIPAAVKIVILVVTLLPVGVLGLMGIGGDSLLQYASHMVMFWIRRRRLHLRRIGYKYENKRTPKKSGKRKKKR